MELVSVWVAPSARGHAGGDASIVAVEKWAVDAGATQLSLDEALNKTQGILLGSDEHWEP